MKSYCEKFRWIWAQCFWLIRVCKCDSSPHSCTIETVFKLSQAWSISDKQRWLGAVQAVVAFHCTFSCAGHFTSLYRYDKLIDK